MPSPIVLQDLSGLQEGLSSGINSAMGAMQQALQTRGEDSKFSNLLAGLEGEEGSVGPFAKALKESGVSSKVGMPLLKSEMESSRRAKKNEIGNNAQDRETYKTNQKLVSGVSSDAKMARGLLKYSNDIEAAIKSPKIPGRGFVGGAKEYAQDLFNITPKEVQTLRSMQKRSLLEMGDTKGIRITDTKLKFLQDNLWDPRKSTEENMEAFKIWRETLEEYIGYEDSVSRVLSENENSMYDPTLSIRISDNKSSSPGKSKQQTVDKPNKTNAEKYKGKVIVNDETGERLLSNGKRWIKQKG